MIGGKICPCGRELSPWADYPSLGESPIPWPERHRLMIEIQLLPRKDLFQDQSGLGSYSFPQPRVRPLADSHWRPVLSVQMESQLGPLRSQLCLPQGAPSTLMVSCPLPETLQLPEPRACGWPTTKITIYLRSFPAPLRDSETSEELKSSKNKGCVLSQAQEKFSISSYLSVFPFAPNLRAGTLVSATAPGHSL